MTLLPPGDSTPGDLSQPGFQTSRVRFGIGEYDVDTGELDGTPDVIFDGQLDRTMLTVGASRELAVSVVSLAERLFELNIGNSLNSAWHKSVWPGELGHDNATRSEEHTYDLQSLMRISYAVFCLKKKTITPH